MSAYTGIVVAVPTALYTAATDYVDGLFDVGEVTGEDEVRWDDVADYLIDAGHPETYVQFVVTVLTVRNASVGYWPEAYNP